MSANWWRVAAGISYIVTGISWVVFVRSERKMGKTGRVAAGIITGGIGVFGGVAGIASAFSPGGVNGWYVASGACFVRAGIITGIAIANTGKTTEPEKKAMERGAALLPAIGMCGTGLSTLLEGLLR
jgi:hypothetical protein